MTDKNSTRVERVARLKWVPIGKMKVSPLAQRELNQARVDHLAAHLDPEQIGHPVVSFRDGHYWLIDGQHRIEALKAIGWGDQSVQCETYEGLDETGEAELFLLRNDTLTVRKFDRFKVGVHAGRDVETDINRIVLSNGLVVSQDQIPGGVRAVGTLERVYKRGGAPVLGRTLRLVRDAYGDPGMEAAVIDGLGHLCQRYNGDLKDEDAVKRLATAHGGVNGLLGKAEQIRRQTGNAKAHCVAAAAVEIINRGRGGKKLPSWWKSES